MHTLHSYRLDSAQVMPPGSTGPSVRCATRADLPAIVELHAIALPRFFWEDPAPAFLRSFYSFALYDLEGWLFVSQHQGHLAGFVAGFSDPSHLFQRIATHKLRFFTSVVSCLVGHPIQLPGLLRDTHKAICLRGEAASCGDAACELVTLAVEPQFRRQGHGRALVQALVEAARTHQMRQLRVCADIHDRGMGYFYRRLGFELFRAFKTPEGKWMDEYVLAIRAE